MRIVGRNPLEIHLLPRGQSRTVEMRSASFDIAPRRKLSRGSERARVFERVAERIRANDPGGLELWPHRPALGEVDPRGELLASWSWMVPLDRLQVAVTAALWLAVLLLLPLVGQAAIRRWRALESTERWIVALAAAGGLLLRLVVPLRLVMIFMGYRLAAEVAQFTTVPKYGAGSFVLYRAAYALFGPSHHTLVGVNTVLGAVTVPLAALLLPALGARRRSAAIAAGLLAFLPIFVKDHRSESLLVPAVFVLVAGAHLLLRALEEQRRAPLFASLPFFAVAVVTRPELILVAVALPWMFGWIVGGEAPRFLLRASLPAGLLLGLAVVPHLVHVLGVTAEQLARGALPALDLALVYKTVGGLFRENAVASFRYFPIPLTALAVAGAVIGAGRLRRIVLGPTLLGLGWIALYYMDLPPPSIPRLHAPGALLITLAGSASLPLLASRLPWKAHHACALGILIVLASSIPSALCLWAPTNEDTEEWLVHRAIASLPDAPVCFVRLGDKDPPPPSKTHRYFPDYLLRPPHRDDRIYGIEAWFAHGRRECNRPAFFFLGLRCYAIYDENRVARPGRPVLVEACEQLLMRHRLDPVFEEEVPNHGQNTFGYWPEVERFRTGLYRLSPRADY